MEPPSILPVEVRAGLLLETSPRTPLLPLPEFLVGLPEVGRASLGGGVRVEQAAEKRDAVVGGVRLQELREVGTVAGLDGVHVGLPFLDAASEEVDDVDDDRLDEGDEESDDAVALELDAEKGGDKREDEDADGEDGGLDEGEEADHAVGGAGRGAVVMHGVPHLVADDAAQAAERVDPFLPVLFRERVEQGLVEEDASSPLGIGVDDVPSFLGRDDVEGEVLLRGELELQSRLPGLAPDAVGDAVVDGIPLADPGAALPVEGVLVFGKNKKATAALNKQLTQNEIKKEYLEKIDYFGNRVDKYYLYKKYSKKYNLNRRIFLYILNQAHAEVGSPKRYDLNRPKKNR